jgi:hypothetical protein
VFDGLALQLALARCVSAGVLPRSSGCRVWSAVQAAAGSHKRRMERQQGDAAAEQRSGGVLPPEHSSSTVSAMARGADCAQEGSVDAHEHGHASNGRLIAQSMLPLPDDVKGVWALRARRGERPADLTLQPESRQSHKARGQPASGRMFLSGATVVVVPALLVGPA